MRILYIFLLLSTLTFSQNKNCIYEIEEKTDSTLFKVLPEKIIYERVFGSSKDFISFTLINTNGIPTLGVQIIQKNTNFIPTKCFDLNSKIIFQLVNGKFITLKCINENTCSILNYNKEEQANIRVLTAYFVFTTSNYEELKKSPLSIMRIQYAGEKEDFNIQTDVYSEISKKMGNPSTFFMDYLHCIE